MPLLGKDLSTLRNDQPLRCFTQSTCIRVGMLTLLVSFFFWHGILTEFLGHSRTPLNWIHQPWRKAWKFCNWHWFQRPTHLSLWFCLGSQVHWLAEQYYSAAKASWMARYNTIRIIASSLEVGFVSEGRFGELVNLKTNLKLNLFSEILRFYSLVEFTKSVLPWRKVTNRDLVHASKISVRFDTRTLFLDKCPKEYDEILTLIDKSNFIDVPPYERIYALLERVSFTWKFPTITNDSQFFQIMNKNSYSWEQRFDWEDELTTCSSATNCSNRESEHADKDNKTDKTAMLPDWYFIITFVILF